jgi:serine/threonine protein kinase
MSRIQPREPHDGMSRESRESQDYSREVRDKTEKRPGTFEVGDVIDRRYELRRDLGRGAAGVVFEARHRFTGRPVALKIVTPDASWSAVSELRARLLREARALAAVRHPGIVDILDGGITDDGTPYIVLEMLEGRTLEGLLAARGKLSKDDTTGIILQLCDALGAAHAAGIVHRDIKPGNIFVVRDRYGYERIKLVDFGIAQISEPREKKLTGIGALIGTPEYMAPEQLLAFGDIDARSDVYALGVTFFECLSGRVPYVGNYQQVLIQAATPDAPPSLLDFCPEAGEALAAVVGHAITKRREDRTPNVAALARAIQEAMPTGRTRTRLLGVAPAKKLEIVKEKPSQPTSRPAIAAAAGQRRRAIRAPYATPVRIVVPTEAGMPDGQVLTLEGRNEDISEGGMLVICRDGCPVNRRVYVRFALPTDGRIVTLPADTRWVRAARPGDTEGPRAIGLEFARISPDVAEAISAFVTRMNEQTSV